MKNSENQKSSNGQNGISRRSFVKIAGISVFEGLSESTEYLG